MAERFTSLLLFDHASVRRSLNRMLAGAGNRLGPRAATWVGALESGEIVAPSTRRRFAERRCYAEDGDGFAEAGFDVIRVGGRTGVSAEVQIAIDAVDALAGDTFDEIVLMMTGGAVVPIMQRIAGVGCRAVVLSDGGAGDRSELADGTIAASDLSSLLMPEAGARPNPVDREEIEAFARKVSNATNVPLLSPKAYAQLFGCLAEEISENGYDFRSTAQNVTDRLAGLGRKIPRRQVVFVVKGLALKGHVFTIGETAHHLAEVFGEQVRYLMDQAGIAADETSERLLDAWLIEKASAPIRRPEPPRSKPPGTGGTPPRPAEKPTAQPPKRSESRAAPSSADRPASASRPVSGTPGVASPRPSPPKPPAASPTPAKSADSSDAKSPTAGPTAARPAQEKPVAPTTGRAPRQPAAAPERKPAPQTERKPVAATGAEDSTGEPAGIRSAEQIKSEIAARIAAAVEQRRAAARASKPAERPAPARNVAPKPDPEVSRADTPAEPSGRKPAVDAPLESSILAAIAQAVDVLVDSDGDDKGDGDGWDGVDTEGGGDRTSGEPDPRPRVRQQRAAPPPSRAAEPRETPRPKEDPAPEVDRPAGEPTDASDDIGDEIQRIIASFGRRGRE